MSVRVSALLFVGMICGCGPSAGDESTRVAQRAAASAVAAIDYFCDHLAPIAKDEAHRRLFATISANGEDAPWREYAIEEHLQSHLQTLGTYQVAELWKRDDGAVFVATTAASDTGDWNRAVKYCYRPDGSLARSEFTMNSFVVDGGIRGIRIRHFAANGDQLAAKSETRDLESGEERSRHDFDDQEPIYKTVAGLPFAALLGGKSPLW